MISLKNNWIKVEHFLFFRSFIQLLRELFLRVFSNDRSSRKPHRTRHTSNSSASGGPRGRASRGSTCCRSPCRTCHTRYGPHD